MNHNLCLLLWSVVSFVAKGKFEGRCNPTVPDNSEYDSTNMLKSDVSGRKDVDINNVL